MYIVLYVMLCYSKCTEYEINENCWFDADFEVNVSTFCSMGYVLYTRNKRCLRAKTHICRHSWECKKACQDDKFHILNMKSSFWFQMLPLEWKEIFGILRVCLEMRACDSLSHRKHKTIKHLYFLHKHCTLLNYNFEHWADGNSWRNIDSAGSKTN